MISKLLLWAAVCFVCEGVLQTALNIKTAPVRFLLNNLQPGRQGVNWNYEIVNGRPIVSGYINPQSYATFGLNPQTGQIEQVQIVTQSRPGGPITSLIQNIISVAGQFIGQITGSFGNPADSALQIAGQFGQGLPYQNNPIISIIGTSQPQPPIIGGIVRPPVNPSVPPFNVPTPDSRLALRTIDEAITSLQTVRTNVLTDFQIYLGDEEGEKALSNIYENINRAVSKLRSLKETVGTNPNSALQSGQNSVNVALDNVESSLVKVAGTRGREFIEPIRNRINQSFRTALQVYKKSSSENQQTVDLEMR